MGYERPALPIYPSSDVHTCHWIQVERSREDNLSWALAGPPKLDSGVDVSTIQLVGYQTSSKEIGDLYHQVYALEKLPGPQFCGPERAWEIMKDILSSLKDCLRWRKGEQSGGSGEPESASPHPSCQCNWASRRGRQDSSGEQELPKAREAYWQALAAATTLKECIERLSQSTTRLQPHVHHCSHCQDWPKRSSWGQICRYSRTPPEEGHQSWSPPLSLTGFH